ncbi:MAG: hypothetical protein QOG67_121 [Verrucomicrobiota bacterium]|jgi:uncharacterized flavoprotein (TIGR03862 family)
MNSVLIIGGGPAGMRAAEVASALRARTILCDAQASFGRKFLIAGRGGLNLTHSEPVENFPGRYGTEPERWRDLLNEFGPAHLQEWANSLGIETYVGSSGRIFPRGQKAAGLLRAWLERLRTNGVEFQTRARFSGLERVENGWSVRFGDREFEAKAVVLALGGASYPETGSDGKWPAILAQHGIEVTPWQPANCGWEVNWSPEFLERAEGKPLKNLTVRAGRLDRVSPHREIAVSGELLITRYGLEGGAIYRLGPALREMREPELLIDFKPQLSADILRERAANLSGSSEWFRSWKLNAPAVALLETNEKVDDLERAIEQVKNFRIPLQGPRPIEEAISSAGGVPWSELDERLMLHKMPGVFVAGEMIDWEAPTGGYLLQGCFATGNRAGKSAAAYGGES